MEPRDAVDDVTPAAQTAEPDSADAGESRRARPAAVPLDPLERLGLVFFALTLVGLFFVVPVVRDILKAPERATPIYKLSAEELHAAYVTDRRAAHERYGAKTVIVTGVVRSVGSDARKVPYVTLRAAGSGEVRCLFRRDDAAVLIGVEEGREATVRGTCEGLGASRGVIVRAANLE